MDYGSIGDNLLRLKAEFCAVWRLERGGITAATEAAWKAVENEFLPLALMLSDQGAMIEKVHKINYPTGASYETTLEPVGTVCWETLRQNIRTAVSEETFSIPGIPGHPIKLQRGTEAGPGVFSKEFGQSPSARPPKQDTTIRGVVPEPKDPVQLKGGVTTRGGR